MIAALVVVCLVAPQLLCAQPPDLDRPDIYGLINILYIKADGNLDGTITHAELSDVFKGFDKNHDGTVTRQEFVELWMLLTSQTSALANAYFHLADVTDDNVINDSDYGPIYQLFDLNHDGKVTSTEFATKWEGIIRETPFAVLFTRADQNKDELLSLEEFRNLFGSFDNNHDNKVDNPEFDAGWSHADFALQSDADLLFHDFDRNHDGFIAGAADMDHFFSVYDSNGDRKMSLQEVIQMKGMLVLQNGHITG